MMQMQDEEQELDEIKDVTPWDDGLKAKERLFILEMCTSDENWLRPDKAYKEVYKSYDKATDTVIYLDDKSASKGANRLLKRPRVKEGLKRLLYQMQPELDETNVYKTLHDMQLMAFYNPADIIDDEGQLKKSLDELGDLAKCVKQIKQTKYGTEVVLEDRFKYIEALCRYLNIIRPEVQTEVSLPVVAVAPKTEGNELMDAIDAWNATASQGDK